MVELCLSVPPRLAAEAEALFWAEGVWGLMVEDEDTGLHGEVRLRCWVEEAGDLAARVQATLGPAARLTATTVDPAAWTLPEATPLGRGFCVVSGGAEPLPDRQPLHLEPGAAWGGGEHPSTTLVVDHLEAGGWPRGPTLDVGTGTGVLTLIAAALGAGPLSAAELDPAARAAAARAFTRHGLEVALRAALPAGPFDLVLANLPFAAQRELAPALAACLAPAVGRLVLSGFPEEAEPALRPIWEAAGLAVVEARAEAGWALRVLVRADGG